MRPGWAFLAVLLAACGSSGKPAGRLELSWTGADTGTLAVPAAARWCALDTVLQVTGGVGDSGAAIGLFAADTVRPGNFPVTEPIPTRSRPGARVALRWPGLTMVEGYYSVSGDVTVESGALLAGRVRATMKSVNNASELEVIGTFRDLAVAPGNAGECGPPPVSMRGDST